MHIPVTLLYGGLSALLVTLLGVRVSLMRIGTKTGVGKELPKELVRPIRAHGNAAEWVPLGILLLAMLEIAGVGTASLHVLGGGMLLARVIHVTGVLARNRLSMVGATINYLVFATMSGWAIWLHFAA